MYTRSYFQTVCILRWTCGRRRWSDRSYLSVWSRSRWMKPKERLRSSSGSISKIIWRVDDDVKLDSPIHLDIVIFLAWFHHANSNRQSSRNVVGGIHVLQGNEPLRSIESFQAFVGHVGIKSGLIDHQSSLFIALRRLVLIWRCSYKRWSHRSLFSLACHRVVRWRTSFYSWTRSSAVLAVIYCNFWCRYLSN